MEQALDLERIRGKSGFEWLVPLASLTCVAGSGIRNCECAVSQDKRNLIYICFNQNIRGT